MAFGTPKRFLLGLDTYERHKFVSRLIDQDEVIILDMGGEPKFLELFLPGKETTVANLDRGDVVCDGKNTPFADGAFDVVTCLDVLEHVPKEDRLALIEELVRIARKKVIFCAPLGSPGHEEDEKDLVKFFRERKVEVSFLEEHISEGLPTLEEVKGLLRNYDAQLYFSGDWRLKSWLARLAYPLDEGLKGKLTCWPRRVLRWLVTIYWKYFAFRQWANKPYSDFVNRIYAVVRVNEG